MNRRRFIELLTGTTVAASLPLSVADGIIAYTEEQYLELPPIPTSNIVGKLWEECLQASTENYMEIITDQVMKESFLWTYLKRKKQLPFSTLGCEEDPLKNETRWDSSNTSGRKWQSYTTPSSMRHRRT